MKYILTIVFLGNILFEGYHFSESIILWTNERKLGFIDFRRAPDENSKFSALSYVGISYTYTYNDSGFEVKVYSTFNKDSSWIKSNSNRLLSHEQGHFTITELFARKFKFLITRNEFSKKDFSLQLEELFNKILDQENELHNKYDLESDFSKDSLSQKKWEVLIDSSLKSYKNFNSDNRKVVKKKWIRNLK